MTAPVQPQVYNLPEVDRVPALLLLGVIGELREKHLLCTESVTSALWHALFETREAGGRLSITGRSKISDGTLRWLAAVHPRDFIATILSHMDVELQASTLAQWRAVPQEKSEIVAGLRRWQEQFRRVWQEMVNSGQRPLMQVLKGAA